MKFNKTIALISVLVFLIIVLVVVQLLKPAPEKQTPLPLQKQALFKISSTTITQEPLSPAQPIKITFDSPASKQNLKVTTVPEVAIKTTFNKNLTEMTIEPIEIWDYNSSYILRITKEENNSEEKLLDKDYQFTFKTLPFSGI
jgi:hypothetical protein